MGVKFRNNMSSPFDKALNQVCGGIFGATQRPQVSLNTALEEVFGELPEGFDEQSSVPAAAKAQIMRGGVPLGKLETWIKDARAEWQQVSFAPDSPLHGLQLHYDPTLQKLYVLAVHPEARFNDGEKVEPALCTEVPLQERILPFIKRRGYDVSRTVWAVFPEDSKDHSPTEMDFINVTAQMLGKLRATVKNVSGSLGLATTFTVRSQQDLNTLVSSVRSAIVVYKPEGMHDQLRTLFPLADPCALENVLVALNSESSSLQKVSDKTMTGTVLRFLIDGKEVYGKIGGNVALIQREAQYLKDAWTHQLMRAITPKNAGVVASDGVAALFTYGTMNNGIVSLEDTTAYFDVRDKLFAAYAKKRGIDSKLLLQDEFATDVLNRAIAHTYMREHVTEEIFSRDITPVVYKFDALVERASRTTNKRLLTHFGELQAQYEIASSALFDVDLSNDLILAHADCRQENICQSRYKLDTRPICDAALARPAFPELDLSKLESGNDARYTRMYAFFRTSLEQMEGRNFELTNADVLLMAKRIRYLSALNCVRTASSKLSRDVIADANMYLCRAARLFGEL